MKKEENAPGAIRLLSRQLWITMDKNGKNVKKICPQNVPHIVTSIS